MLNIFSAPDAFSVLWKYKKYDEVDHTFIESIECPAVVLPTS